MALLKVGIAAAVISWMIGSGRLDVRAVADAATQWKLLSLIAAIFYLQVFVLSLRWRILARALGYELSRTRAFSLSMIGMLFNTAVPGSVGGDVLKAYYACGGKSDRSGPIASIVVDRVVGLFSLILLAVAGSAWNSHLLWSNVEVRAFWFALTISLVILAASAALTLTASSRLSLLLGRVCVLPAVRAVLMSTLEVLSAYNRKRWSLLQSLALSVPCHLLAIAAFYAAIRSVAATSVELGMLVFLVPLGLVTTAVPLAPGGIGIGQAAFYSLFAFVLPGKGPVGSSAFTVYQLVLILVSLSGIVFYLRDGRVAAPKTLKAVRSA